MDAELSQVMHLLKFITKFSVTTSILISEVKLMPCKYMQGTH